MSNRGDKVPGFTYSSPSIKERMEAFDSLPPEVRRVLANASANTNPVSVYRYIQNGASVQDALSRLSATDRKFIANAYADRGVSL